MGRAAGRAAVIALARGDGFLAIDKPAGAIVVRDRQGVEETLFDRARVELGEELFLVHRLDRETSGVLVFATSADAQRRISKDFEEGRVAKEYVALVVGVPRGNEGRVAHPIAEGRKGRMVIRDGGKPSATRWRVLDRFPSACALPPAFKGAEPIERDPGHAWIEARPETGRTHQIRVHAADHGWPLLGDPLYGKTPPKLAAIAKALGRQALHAAVLELVHPATGARMRFTSPLPEDMRAALTALGGTV